MALVSMANLTGSWIPCMTRSMATVINTRRSEKLQNQDDTYAIFLDCYGVAQCLTVACMFIYELHHEKIGLDML